MSTPTDHGAEIDQREDVQEAVRDQMLHADRVPPFLSFRAARICHSRPAPGRVDPAIDRGTLPVSMAGSSPGMTVPLCVAGNNWARKPNSMQRRHVTAALALGIPAWLAARRAAWGDEFPSRPVMIIVPYGAGGGVSINARALAPYFEKTLGTRVLVENREGSVAEGADRETTFSAACSAAEVSRVANRSSRHSAHVLPTETCDDVFNFRRSRSPSPTSTPESCQSHAP